MNCPNCGKKDWQDVANTAAAWCTYCGTLQTPAGSIVRPTIATNLNSISNVGLLAVAKDAIGNAQRCLDRSNHHTNPSPALKSAIGQALEAICAIIYELDARDREPTAAERADARQSMLDVQAMGSLISKAIRDGVDAVQTERERCAKIAESFNAEREGWIGGSAGPELAKRIRRVPT